MIGNAPIGLFANRAIALKGSLTPGEQQELMVSAIIENYRGEQIGTPELLEQAYAIQPDVSGWSYRVLRTMSLPGIASIEQMRQLVAGLEAYHVNPTATGREATEQAWVLIGYALAATNLGDTARALELAPQTLAMAHRGGAPSTIARAHQQIGMTLASTDPDQARRHFKECIDLGRAGVRFSGLGGAYMQTALIDAQQGRHQDAARNMIAAITSCRPAGRTAELDGACGYAVELLELLGDTEAALIIIGSILDGELRVLRDMPAPPGRTPPDVRAMRELVGKERFSELIARGAGISYDEILDHIIASLHAVELSDFA
jgi:hypothetical protein